MIIEVEGDILMSRAHAIAHGVASNDPMNQGLALALHEHYPSMHKDFHHWCHVHHPKPGEAWMWGGPQNVRVVNLLTQDGGEGHAAKPGKATVSNVNRSLRALAKMVPREGFESIALPRLATGVGGLDWKDVWPLMQRSLGELEIPVYVYTKYVPGQEAKEG